MQLHCINDQFHFCSAFAGDVAAADAGGCDLLEMGRSLG